MIAVVGPGDTSDAVLLADAAEVGRLAVLAGHDVVTGGLGGVMAAASRGAHEAGGRVVGVLPGDDPGAANEWVDEPVPTGSGQARNAKVVELADAVVGVGGSWGTLARSPSPGGSASRWCGCTAGTSSAPTIRCRAHQPPPKRSIAR